MRGCTSASLGDRGSASLGDRAEEFEDHEYFFILALLITNQAHHDTSPL